MMIMIIIIIIIIIIISLNYNAALHHFMTDLYTQPYKCQVSAVARLLFNLNAKCGTVFSLSDEKMYI
jgi:hypothetical protein